jgi:hypothetical protein
MRRNPVPDSPNSRQRNSRRERIGQGGAVVEVAGLPGPKTGDTDSSPPPHAVIEAGMVSCSVSFGGVISMNEEVGHEVSPPETTSL